MTASTKTKKGKAPKPPAGRPYSTSAPAHALPADAAASQILSAFSSKGDYLALVSRGADRHRLRVYDALTAVAIGEHACQDRARVTALTWAAFDLDSPKPADNDEDEAEGMPSAKRKRRRKSKGTAAGEAMAVDEPSKPAAAQVVILGLSTGSLVLFSPAHGRTLRTLSHASSTAEISALTPALDGAPRVWAAGADGMLRLWDVRTGGLLGSWRSPLREAYSALAIRPGDEKSRLLSAHHTLRLLDCPTPSDGPAGSEHTELNTLATCTGHASAVRALYWVSRERCLSSAESDRFVSVWQIPDDEDEEASNAEGTLLASVALDADVRRFTVAPAPGSGSALLALSASGRVTVHGLAEALPVAGRKQKVASLPANSTIVISPKKGTTEDVLVVDACFVPENVGRVRVARLVGGARPLFDDVVRMVNGSLSSS